jgi:hypothetical protein
MRLSVAAIAECFVIVAVVLASALVAVAGAITPFTLD